MRALRRSIALALALSTLAAAPAGAQDSCLGEPEAEGVTPMPGPALRFGINPAGEAGALGPAVEPVPGTPAETLAALAHLAPPAGPFYVRLNRFFWSEGVPGIRRFQKLARRYTRHGYLVELQLRYHPRPEQEGRIDRWVKYVRRVTRKFGRNPGVRAIQVTNEVNFTISPDSSDGAYDRARKALVRGVIAAKRVARHRDFNQLKIGFNWFYRTDPGNERSFWGELAAAKPRFRRAVDWVGLDAYPGTFFPPVELDDGYRDGIVNALSTLRCFMTGAGIPEAVPIHVEENGYPTLEPTRSYAEQVNAMRQMVGAVHDFRGTFNVTDYRWFDLRDHRTSSQNFQHQYGLLRDDYTPKPAFEVYRELVAELARRKRGKR